jgi:tetratricopeptide (TPR) repeat protein
MSEELDIGGKASAEELLIIGERYIEEGKYEEAIKVYKEIIKKEPTRPTLAKVCNDCGVVYASLEEYEMAIGFFNAAINLKDFLIDDGVSAYFNLACVYRILGENEKADQYFKMGEKIRQEYIRRNEEAQNIFCYDE